MRCPRLEDLPEAPPGRIGWPWTETSPRLRPTRKDGRPWPRITIVTPSYNQGQFLEETIRSVLLQGYPDLEYIVADGGSTDGSLQVIRQYEPWLSRWVSEPDRGQAHAINKGWVGATGELLTWLNSDDSLPPGWAARAVEVLVSRPNLDLVCGDVLAVDGQGHALGLLKGHQPQLETMVLYWLCPFPQQGFLMRRRVLERCGLLDETLQFALDFDYWVRLLLNGRKIHHVPKVFGVHRFHRATKTETQYAMAIADFLRITEKFAAAAPEGLRSLAERARQRTMWNAAMCAFGAGDGKMARRFAREQVRRSGIVWAPKVAALSLLTLLDGEGLSLLRWLQHVRRGSRRSPSDVSLRLIAGADLQGLSRQAGGWEGRGRRVKATGRGVWA